MARRAEWNQQRAKALLKLVILLLLLVFLGQIIFYLVISPRLRLKEVVLESEFRIPVEEVRRVAGLGEQEYFYSLEVDQIAARLETIPTVRKAVVTKEFPEKLKIILYKREPLFISLVPTAKGTMPLLFDTNGVAYQWDRELGDYDYPVISGIQFDKVKKGMELPDLLDPLLLDLKRIKDNSPGLFHFISELKVQKKGEQGFELLLYPNRVGLAVHLGGSLKEETLKQVLVVMDIFSQKGEIPKEIDLRTDHVVYSNEEG